jgi:hypothetical protein
VKLLVIVACSRGDRCDLHSDARSRLSFAVGVMLYVATIVADLLVLLVSPPESGKVRDLSEVF